jgi:F0F1-type ATP synthase membrane subunit a
MLAGTHYYILLLVCCFFFKVDSVLGFINDASYCCRLCFEFGIAFLQAYVFVVLLAIYLKESCYGAGH